MRADSFEAGTTASESVYLADAGQRRNLPDSASLLPSLGLLGLVLAGVAGVLRTRRTVNSAK